MLFFAVFLHNLMTVAQIQHQVVNVLLCRIHVLVETCRRAEDEAAALAAVGHALIDQVSHMFRRREQ